MIFPTYEELKNMKDYKTYSIWFPPIGGYFQLTRNEDGKNTIALDYIEGGYLCGILTVFKSKYHFNKLYKFNKTNYNGLIKLFWEMIQYSYKDISKMMNTYEIYREMNNPYNERSSK